MRTQIVVWCLQADKSALVRCIWLMPYEKLYTALLAIYWAGEPLTPREAPCPHRVVQTGLDDGELAKQSSFPRRFRWRVWEFESRIISIVCISVFLRRFLLARLCWRWSSLTAARSPLQKRSCD